MGGKGILIAAAVLAALAGTLWWSNTQKAKEAAKPAAETSPKIVSLTEADLKKIEIKKKDGADTVLEKNGSGKWTMTAPQTYPVDQDAAGSLASSAASIASDRVVEDKAADLKPFGLDAPSLEVDLTAKDGKTRRLLIGDDVPGAGSFYAKLASDPRVFAIASFTKTNFDKNPKDLRDKRLLTFDNDKLSRIELLSKGKDIEFGRNKDEWQILKPQPMRADGLQVEELVRKLKDAKMDTSLSDEDAKKAAASFASGAPVATVKVTDPSGTQELQVRKKGDDYYAKSSGTEGAFKVASDLGTGLDKSVADFRNKKLFEFGYNDPNTIDIRQNGKNYTFQKAGEKWYSNGKEMDNTSVQSLVDKLRDLSAAKFVESGFGTPAITITVGWQEGKRMDKVEIAKPASGAPIARRDGEPALYELESKAVDDIEKSAGDVKPATAAAKKK